MLKKLLTLAFLGLGTFVYAKVNTVVSILPQQTFVKTIGGDKVNVSLMINPGNSPHTYEPKPSQMRDISQADIYFFIGIEFEESWLPKFANQNKKMKLANIGKGINKIKMKGEHRHGDHVHKDGSHDPHIWTTPQNAKIIGKNILKYLVRIDKKNKKYYENNYNTFVKSLDDLDIQIKNILKDTPKNTKFMVFHPSWGYFARQYNLTQVAIEVEGKEPKPKDVVKLIEAAKKQNIKAILTAPEFSDKVARQIANALHIKVVNISPLDPQWSKNLIYLAKIIGDS